MKLRTVLGSAAAAAAAVLVMLPAAAFATGPALTPQTIFTEGFEGTTASRLTLDWVVPGPGNPAPAYWGKSTGRKHAGTYGLWCAGSVPNGATNAGWTTFSGKYPDYTEGVANFTVPEMADYYSASLGFWYIMPSVGAADGESFNVMWGHQDPQSWDAPHNPAVTGAWTYWSQSITAPTLAGNYQIHDMSRDGATSVRFNFIDNSGDPNESPSTGEGPTIDDVTVTGYKYGPVRNLAAAGGSGGVTVVWTVPAASTSLIAPDDTRPIAYRVWRSPDVQPYVWTELTSVRISGTTFNDTAPLDGGARYLVQAWDPTDDLGWGELAAAATVYVAPPVPVTTLNITGGSPDSNGTYTSLPTITLTRDAVKGTTSYRWDGGTLVTSAAQSLVVQALNGQHTLEYYSTNSLGTPENHHTQTVVVNIPQAGPPPITTVTISGTRDSSGAYISPTVRITRDQADGITYYSLDGASEVSTTTASFTLAVGPGSHALAAYSVSANGVPESVKAPVAFVVKAKPSVSTPSLSTSRPRHGRYFYIRGSLGPAHTASTTVRLYIERYSSGRYRSYKIYTVTLPAGATSYSYKVTLSLTGKYRVRAYHTDTLHTATYSGYRNFIVYT